MSIDMTKFGSTKRIAFKLVDSTGAGVNVTLVAGDVKLSRNTGSGFSAGFNVTNQPQLIDSTNMPGCYQWLPTGSEMQAQAIMLNIKDQTSPAAFVENSIVIATGGDTNAFYSG